MTSLSFSFSLKKNNYRIPTCCDSSEGIDKLEEGRLVWSVVQESAALGNHLQTKKNLVKKWSTCNAWQIAFVSQ